MLNCTNLLKKMATDVDLVNTKIIDHMTNPSMSYEKMCQYRDVTPEYFFEELKEEWNKSVDEFISRQNTCPDDPSVGKFISKVRQIPNFDDTESAINYLLDDTDNFEINDDLQVTAHNFIKFFTKHCGCEKITLLKILSRKYFQKYFPIYASKPEVKAYVSGKILFILDHIIALSGQIHLETEEGKKEVDKLIKLLNHAKNTFSQSQLNQTGGSNSDILKQRESFIEYDSNLKEIKNQIKKIKDVDHSKAYHNILDKIITRLGLIHEQIAMMIPSSSILNKQNLINKMEEIKQKINTEMKTAKETAKELIPKNFDSRILIKRINLTLDTLHNNLLMLQSSISDNSSDLSLELNHMIKNEMRRMNVMIEKLEREGSNIYGTQLQKIKSAVANIQTEIQKIELPEINKEKIEHELRLRINNLSSMIPDLNDKIRKIISEIKTTNPGLAQINQSLIESSEILKNMINNETYKINVKSYVISLQTDLETLKQNLQSFAKNTNQNNIQNNINLISDKIDSTVAEIKTILNMIREKREHIIQTMLDEFDVLKSKIPADKDSIRLKIDNIREDLKTLITDTKNSDLMKKVLKSIDALKQEIHTMDPPTLKELIQRIDSHITALKNKYTEMRPILKKNIDPLTQTFIQKLITLSESIDRFDVSSLRNIEYKEQMMEKMKNIKDDINEILNQVPELNIRDESSNTIKELYEEKSKKIIEEIEKIVNEMRVSDQINLSLKDIEKAASEFREEATKYFQYAFIKFKERIQKGGNDHAQNILFEGDPKERRHISQRISSTLEMVESYMKDIDISKTKDFYGKIIDDISQRLSHIYSFSVESELDRLIPNELGSLKKFFIKVISVYYDNLHPIIWAQIFNQMVCNFMTELPHTPEEFFQFASKYLLLNSGPFILKTLQMIRPILSPELATKYNLTKLKYPLMNYNQIDLIMNKVVPDWKMLELVGSFSASVGHVLMVSRRDNPENVFIIKMIKPISIAQSCWEYKTLYNIYLEDTCERSFVQSIIKSNGKEMNVMSEIKNIDTGYKYYTGTYREAFGYDVDANITTVQNISQVVNSDCWFALAMTLAPGIPLSQLVEGDSLNKDTKYRAKLHRSLDLLVYHFFHGIMKGGFYHGDLHAGNIFFSYEKNQLTLIDFGAVGELNIMENNDDTYHLLLVFILSLFHNFDGIFDLMTDNLNSKCTSSGDIIDKGTESYVQFKETLKEYHVNNISLDEIQRKKSKEYMDFIFGEDRLNDEIKHAETKENTSHIALDSVYSHMEIRKPSKEIVVENSDILRTSVNTMSAESGSDIEVTYTSFPQALEQIIKFYAQCGVNIAIKFTDFYEFQKAYALLLGVLSKTGYNTYRIGMAAAKAIKQISNIPITHPIKMYDIYSKYSEQNDIYKYLQDRIDNTRGMK